MKTPVFVKRKPAGAVRPQGVSFRGRNGLFSGAGQGNRWEKSITPIQHRHLFFFMIFNIGEVFPEYVEILYGESPFAFSGDIQVHLAPQGIDGPGAHRRKTDPLHGIGQEALIEAQIKMLEREHEDTVRWP